MNDLWSASGCKSSQSSNRQLCRLLAVIGPGLCVVLAGIGTLVVKPVAVHGNSSNKAHRVKDAPLRFPTDDERISSLTRYVVKGLDINARFKNEDYLFLRGMGGSLTPLMIAASSATGRDSVKLVAELLARGAHVNARDDFGRTALMHIYPSRPTKVGKRRSWEIFKLLVEHHADVNVRDAIGRTPLMYGFDGQFQKALLAHGAKMELKDESGQTALMLMCYKIEDDMTAASDTVAIGLIAAGADVNARDNGGNTPLMCAAQITDKFWRPNALRIARVLISHGARIEAKNRNGETALNIARGNHFTAMIKLLATHERRVRSGRARH